MSASVSRLADDHPVRKDLRSLGYECRRWLEAQKMLQTRVAKGRFSETVLAFLHAWMPAEAVQVADAESFELHHSESGLISPELPGLGNPAWQALLHLPALREFWTAELRAAHYQHLVKMIPQAWCMDATPLPPGAVIAGLGISTWEELSRLEAEGRKFQRQPLNENRVVLTAVSAIGDSWRARYVKSDGQITLQDAWHLA